MLEHLANYNKHGVRSWFLTLTYNDENVPKTLDYVQTLRKSDAKKWLRTAKRKAGTFRHFVVGEYGDRTMRPHLHALVFPQSDTEIRPILDAWEPRGFTQIREFTDGRAKYISGYTTKKLLKTDDDRLTGDREPEFMLAPRFPAIGASFVPTLVHQYRGSAGKALIEERGDVERTIRIAGRIYPIPAYILKKLRQELGIPVKHSQRLLHEGYQKWWTILDESARWDPSAGEHNRLKIDAKKAIQETRYATI